ncbi:MAG: nucleotidyltransferase domain-containing protein [bacterium]
MRVESSTSAGIEYLNKKDVLPSLRKAARTLKKNPNVISVKLFGSLVRGDYVPGSDADILIVLKHDERRMIDRIPEYLDFFDDVTFPVELFPYSEAELTRMEERGNPFIKEILCTGVEL